MQRLPIEKLVLARICGTDLMVLLRSSHHVCIVWSTHTAKRLFAGSMTRKHKICRSMSSTMIRQHSSTWHNTPAACSMGQYGAADESLAECLDDVKGMAATSLSAAHSTALLPHSSSRPASSDLSTQWAIAWLTVLAASCRWTQRQFLATESASYDAANTQKTSRLHLGSRQVPHRR